MKQTTFCAILLLATGCTSPKKAHTADPLRVGTIVVTPSSDIDAALYVGTIEEETSAALSFPVAGTLARTYADEGQRVQQGQLLAELDPTSARVEAQTRLRQAESAYGIARKNLDDCKLYAPFTGVIGKRQAAAGETVLPGVPAMTLLRIGMVKVRFPVPEQEIARLGTDSRLRITVAALGDRAFPAGKIEKGAVANPATHTYDVRATLSNADGELLPGMVCRVEASPAGAAEEIALPVRAVQQAGDGSRFVWKVSGDSVVRTAVATGRLVNNAVTITAGIQAGDRIVTDGMQKIGQGSKVIAE